jgi:hypothetical protein
MTKRENHAHQIFLKGIALLLTNFAALKHIRCSIHSTWTTNQQCLEPFASFAGSINILLSTLLSTHALKICFRTNDISSEL